MTSHEVDKKGAPLKRHHWNTNFAVSLRPFSHALQRVLGKHFYLKNTLKPHQKDDETQRNGKHETASFWGEMEKKGFGASQKGLKWKQLTLICL